MAVLQNCGKHVSWARHLVRSLWSTFFLDRSDISTVIFWDVLPYSLVDVHLHLRVEGRCCLHLQGRRECEVNLLLGYFWLIGLLFNTEWRQCVPPKRLRTSIRVYGVIRACSNCMSIYRKLSDTLISAFKDPLSLYTCLGFLLHNNQVKLTSTLCLIN